MERSVLERWEAGAEAFYDSVERKLLLKRGAVVQTLQVDTLVTGRHVLTHAVLDVTERIFAYSCDGNALVIYRQTVLFLPTLTRHVIQAGPNREILGFHFLSFSAFCDFVLIHSFGIDCYQVYRKELSVRHRHYYKARLAHYWFEPVSGVLVAESAKAPNPLLTFFLHEEVDCMSGPEFELDAGVRWTTRAPHNRSLQLCDYKGAEDTYEATLARVYGEVRLIVLIARTGAIAQFRVQKDRVERLGDTLYAARGVSEIRAIDGVLAAQNVTLQRSFLYDEMMDEPQNALCVSDHVAAETAGERTEAILNSSIVDLCTATTIVDSMFPLSLKLLAVDQDVSIDIVNGVCYLFGIRVRAISECLKEPLENVKFLLRRKDCFQIALSQVSKELSRALSLSDISALLAQVITFVRSDTDYSQRVPRVDLPLEVWRDVLQPLWTGEQAPEYRFSVMLEYQRLALEAGLALPEEFGDCFAAELLRHQRLRTLQELLEGGVLSDSKETALVMKRAFLDTGDWYFLAACVDMLWRLSLYEEAAELLSSSGLAFESTVCLDTASFLYVPEPATSA